MTDGQRRHTHVAGTTVDQDIDKCAECGLDLRNPIHLRVIPGAIVRTQPEDYDALQAALENAPEPTDKLKSLMRGDPALRRVQRDAVAYLADEITQKELVIEELVDGLKLARNRLRAAAINETASGGKHGYEYSEWADEAEKTLAKIGGRA